MADSDNQKRPKNPDTRLDFSDAYLQGRNFKGANLRDADSSPHLYMADEGYTDLTNANLAGANLTKANLGFSDLTGANLDGADFTGVDLSKVQGLTQAQIDGICFDWRDPPALPDGLILPKKPKPKDRAMIRAQRSVFLIHGISTFLNLSQYLNFEDSEDQSLVNAFRAAVDTLKDELVSKDDQIAALTEVIYVIQEDNAALREENQRLQTAAKEAASLGQKCREKFLLRLSEKAADGIAIGVGAALTAGALYLVGQWGGEIADFFSETNRRDGTQSAPSNLHI